MDIESYYNIKVGETQAHTGLPRTHFVELMFVEEPDALPV